MPDADTLETVEALAEGGYKWGFSTDIETELAPALAPAAPEHGHA